MKLAGAALYNKEKRGGCSRSKLQVHGKQGKDCFIGSRVTLGSRVTPWKVQPS